MSVKVLTVVPPQALRISDHCRILSEHARQNSDPQTIVLTLPASPTKPPLPPAPTKQAIMSDPRYYPKPETRRLVPERSSKDYAVVERRSAEKVGSGGVVPISTETYVTAPSRSSAAYSGSVAGAYAGRPRRNTLDLDSATHISSKPRTVVTHQHALPRPSSPLPRTYDRDSAYVTASSSSRPSQPKREHKRLYSVDDTGYTQSVHNLLTAPADPYVRNKDSWGADERRERDLVKEKRDQRREQPRELDRQYHLTGTSHAKARNIDESAYGYTDAAGMFRETEPKWRSRRGSVDGRTRDRPVSLLVDSEVGYPHSQSQRPSREMGPPPTTRGFGWINKGLERGGSVRDTAETRASSRERRAMEEPKHLTIDRAATFDMPIRPSSTRPPVESDSRNHQRLPADQRYDYNARRDPYDERSYRQPSREPRAPERQYTDHGLESRGFGIRTGSVEYSSSSREESRDDRRLIYPGGPLPVDEGPRALNISDYVPSHVLQNDSRHHARHASDREDFRERPREGPREPLREPAREAPREALRDRYQPADDYDNDRLRAQDPSGSRHSSVQSGDAHGSRHSSVQAGLGLASGAAGLGLGAYAAKKAAEDRSRERRYDDDDVEDDRRPRRGTRADERDLEERPGPPPERRDRGVERERDSDRERERDRDRDRDRARERDRERDRRREQDEAFEREQQRERERERSVEEKPLAIEDAKAGAEEFDPDEEYRRRVQQAAAELAGVTAPLSREPTREDDRRRRDRDLVTEPDYPPTRRSREDMAGALPPRGSKDELAPAVPAIAAAVSMPALGSATREAVPPGPLSDFVPPPREDFHNQRPRQEALSSEKALMQEPTELALPPASTNTRHCSDHSDAHPAPSARPRSSSFPSKEARVRIVEPPKEEKESPPIRGILKKPKERFPEDPNPVREGVTTTKDPKRDQKARKEGIPSDARWTKIDRSWVNPQALVEANERFEERMDCVIVLRVLTKNEIQKYADRTRQIRDEREGRDDRSSRRKHGDDEDRPKDRDRRDRDKDRDRERDRGHDRDDKKGDGRRRKDRDSDYYDSSEEEYEQRKKEYADLESTLRREKERPKQIEMSHER